ncbi:MAG: DUF3179 domain-containing protein [Gemmatimonadota bacterium]
MRQWSFRNRVDGVRGTGGRQGGSRRGLRLLLAFAVPLVAFGCDFGPMGTTSSGTSTAASCEFEFHDGGVAQDGIPALTNPIMAEVGSLAATYVNPNDRVIGIVIDGQPVAIPHSILWIHEIVNLDVGDARVAVTYCPLTGSSLVFDRSTAGGAEFGVSGMLSQSNLVMYDRRDPQSFWPQMDRRARCGPASGSALPLVPALEMSWAGWRELHPDTRVPANLSQEGQPFGGYGYPYGNYEDPNNDRLLFPVDTIDRRRPLKERVLGISEGPGELGPGQGGIRMIAFPFSALDEGGPENVVEVRLDEREVVVFWSRQWQGAAAYRKQVGDETLDFRVDDGRFVDLQTGSVWDFAGRAVEGPLEGEALTPVAEAYVAFWFAWATFHPRTELWGEASSGASGGPGGSGTSSHLR